MGQRISSGHRFFTCFEGGTFFAGFKGAVHKQGLMDHKRRPEPRREGVRPPDRSGQQGGSDQMRTVRK